MKKAQWSYKTHCFNLFLAPMRKWFLKRWLTYQQLIMFSQLTLVGGALVFSWHAWVIVDEGAGHGRGELQSRWVDCQSMPDLYSLTLWPQANDKTSALLNCIQQPDSNHTSLIRLWVLKRWHIQTMRRMLRYQWTCATGLELQIPCERGR